MAELRDLAKYASSPGESYTTVILSRRMGDAHMIPDDIIEWCEERYPGERVYYRFVGSINQVTFRPDLNTAYFFANPDFALEFKMRWR